jgi:hypothetical protein
MDLEGEGLCAFALSWSKRICVKKIINNLISSIYERETSTSNPFGPFKFLIKHNFFLLDKEWDGFLFHERRMFDRARAREKERIRRLCVLCLVCK